MTFQQLSRYLTRCWQVLRKRIEHKWHYRIEYSKVNVSGSGVNAHLHVIYKLFSLSGLSMGSDGGFIDVHWLSDAWGSITHGSSVVWIHRVWGYASKAAGYLASQYLAGQEGFIRQSWSRNWVFSGFRGVWRSQFAMRYRTAKTEFERLSVLHEWDTRISEEKNHFNLGHQVFSPMCLAVPFG
jgi:hypothetical protein